MTAPVVGPIGLLRRAADALLERGLRRLAAAERGVAARAPSPAAAIGAGLAVVVPERGTPALLAACLDSLAAALLRVDEPTQVIVQVNGAPRAAYRALQTRFPQVEWRFARRALGFSGAIRRALRAVRQPWVYLLNSDMQLEPDALAELLPWRAPFVFGLASQIFFVDPTRRREETGWTELRLRDDGVDVVDVIPEDDCVRGNLYAGGGASLFRTDVLSRYVAQARGYDPFYFEDVEWGVRAWREGRLVLFCPRSRVHHHHRATVNKHYPPAEIDRIVARNLLLLRCRVLPLPEYLDDLRDAVLAAPWRTQRELVFSTRLRDAARLRPRLAAAPFPFDIVATARLHRFLVPFAALPARALAMVVTPFLPYPSRHGGAVRTTSLVRELARRYHVIVLADEAGALQPLPAATLAGAAALLVVGGRPESGSDRVARARSHTHARLRAMFALFRQALAPRLVQVEHVELAPLITQRSDREAWTIDLHDVTIGVDHDEAANVAERDWLQRYDLALVCSREDAAVLRQDRPQVLQIANGVDLDGIVYEPSARHTAVLFLGPFRYQPNRIGIERFLRQAWPGVRAAMPAAELWILGGDDALAVASADPLYAQPGVSVHGHAPPLGFLTRCALSINPQRGIRGSSLKVIESLAAGRVCVATVDGARGFTADGFAGLVTVDDVGDMAGPIIALLRDEAERLRRERPVPALLAAYTWRHAGDRLHNAYHGLLAGDSADNRAP